MRNIYNKGSYRTERCKHLGPFLKRNGNRRWRKTANQLKLQDLLYDGVFSTHKRTSVPKVYRVATKIQKEKCRRKSVRWYGTLRAAKDSIQRNSIYYYSIEDWSLGKPILIAEWQS